MSPTHEALVEEGTSLYAAPHSEIEKEVDKSDEPIEAEATFDNEPTRGCQIRKYDEYIESAGFYFADLTSQTVPTPVIVFSLSGHLVGSSFLHSNII